MAKVEIIENQQRVAEWVRNQKSGRLEAAVAFWGKNAVETLGLTKKRDFRVLLDLSAGASFPDEVQKLLDLNPRRVRVVHRFHAKTYISDAGVIVGSANASPDGLAMQGSEQTQWHELAILTEDSKAITKARQWFERLWNSGESITPAMMKVARKAWKERQSNRAYASKSGQFILDAAMKNPKDFADREIYITITSQYWTEAGEEEAATIKEQTGREPDGWEDWADIPLNAKFIRITNFEGEGLAMWKPLVCRSEEQAPTGVLAQVHPTSLPFLIGPISKWRKAVNWVKSETDPETWKNELYCKRMDKFVEEYRAHLAAQD